MDDMQKNNRQFVLSFWRGAYAFSISRNRMAPFLSAENDISAITKSNGRNSFSAKHSLKFFKKMRSALKQLKNNESWCEKAVEYFLKEKLQQTSLVDILNGFIFPSRVKMWIILRMHFLWKSVQKFFCHYYNKEKNNFGRMQKQWKSVSLLSRTHGQPASPTTMGKRISYFCYSSSTPNTSAWSTKFLGKLAGASGNYNAHLIAFPQADWLRISESFVTSLGLSWESCRATNWTARFFGRNIHLFVRINTIFSMLPEIYGDIFLLDFSATAQRRRG